MVLPGFMFLYGFAFYARWLVVHGYPPLLVLGAELALFALLRLGMEGGTRRAMAAAYKLGGVKTAVPGAGAWVWVTSALTGVLISGAAGGALSLALTRVSISVVAIAFFAGVAWSRLLAGKIPSIRQAAGMLLGFAGLVMLVRGPDAGGRTVILLLVLGPAGKAVGELLWKLLKGSDTAVRVQSASMLGAAAALLAVGLWRGESFSGLHPSRNSTLALFYPLAMMAGSFILVRLVRGRIHAGVLAYATVGALAAALLVGRYFGHDVLAQATWIAAGLVGAGLLLDPGNPGDPNTPSSI